MRKLSQIFRAHPGQIIIGLIPIAVVVLPIVYFFLDTMFNSCKPDTERTFNLAGYKFEIKNTFCDYGMGVSDYYTSVYATRLGQQKSVLVFEYYSQPENWPTIVATGAQAVEISIGQIDTLREAKTGLDGLSIVYKIGIIGQVMLDPEEQAGSRETGSEKAR